MKTSALPLYCVAEGRSRDAPDLSMVRRLKVCGYVCILCAGGEGMVRRNIILSEELDQGITAAAAYLGEKRSRIVSRAIANYLDRLDLDLARERAEAYEAAQDPGLDSATLRENLGL